MDTLKLLNEEGIYSIVNYGFYYAFISISTLLKLIEIEGLTIKWLKNGI